MKTIVGPDGKMQTVASNETDIQEKLKKTRRELRDMLQGNTQFHEDEFKTPEPPKEPPEHWMFGEEYAGLFNLVEKK